MQIYTDASKDWLGRVGVGCYIRSFPEMEKSARITNGVTVYTGEMVGIKIALESVRRMEQTTSHRHYAIFTDSLSNIDNFTSTRSHSQPRLFAELMDLIGTINCHITLVWVPSHIGIEGNERADRLAYNGSQRQEIDMDVGFELQEAYGRVNHYINLLWQQEWDSETSGRHYYGIQPDVTSRERLYFATRATDVLAYRLRLGKCGLNSYLHQMALRDSGDCTSCGQLETIEHFLITCPSNNDVLEINKFYIEQKVDHSLPAVLRSTTAVSYTHLTLPTNREV